MKNDFLHFGDGTVLINGKKYPFENKTIGIKRNYAARSIGVELEKLIAVPFHPPILGAKYVFIDDVKYKIEQAQVISDSYPKSIQLSLSRNSRSSNAKK